ncbi:ABC transporter ATP-binding protein [Suttonella indologenes]|uniref:Hemin import ATP-binding protein HmuV n=1 Tax=Suttonella indologenes TaxID=13276 RepID=A0A380MWG5_9GAMM|nr:ABC transporter ATP-binding protein [Suttonella indologenes]SUO96909.1 Hemin import ATP-binding protein HmuV [Suttonella indologenes]
MSLQFSHGRISKGTRVILDVPAIRFPDHCISAIIGANGAGKSTLLRQLLQSPATIWRGEPFRLALKQGRCAWVGQHENFQLPMTVLEYVLMGHYPRLVWYRQSPASNRQRAMQWLEIFELDGLKNKRLENLSGGEKQRAAIVRALLQEAEILLMDEPTNHLDIRHQHHLMKQLRLLTAPKPAVIMVLHDINLAAHYSDFVVLMKQGKIAASGSTAEIMQAQVLSDLYDWRILCEPSGNFIPDYAN